MIRAVLSLSGRREGISRLAHGDTGAPAQGTADPAHTEMATAFASAL
jgi:hypothetical protein